jgi:hypothetical protein
VTRELSELIDGISNEARSEAESANVVAANIQHIFAVTEQTGRARARPRKWFMTCRDLPMNCVKRWTVSRLPDLAAGSTAA